MWTAQFVFVQCVPGGAERSWEQTLRAEDLKYSLQMRSGGVPQKELARLCSSILFINAVLSGPRTPLYNDLMAVWPRLRGGPTVPQEHPCYCYLLVNEEGIFYVFKQKQKPIGPSGCTVFSCSKTNSWKLGTRNPMKKAFFYSVVTSKWPDCSRSLSE